MLCENVDQPTIESIARRIDASLAKPLQIHGLDVTLAASTGIVISNDPELDGDDLLAAADAAMYEASARADRATSSSIPLATWRRAFRRRARPSGRASPGGTPSVNSAR